MAKAKNDQKTVDPNDPAAAQPDRTKGELPPKTPRAGQQPGEDSAGAGPSKGRTSRAPSRSSAPVGTGGRY